MRRRQVRRHRGNRTAIQEALFKGLALGPDATREDIASGSEPHSRCWAAHFAATDACVAPVLDLEEAPVHPHNIAGGHSWISTAYSSRRRRRAIRRCRSIVPHPPRSEGEDGETILTELGYSAAEIGTLRSSGVLG